MYHPELIKSILIVRPENLAAGKVFGRRHVFMVCTGARSLGGYIEISKTAGMYTQESYAPVVRVIQS